MTDLSTEPGYTAGQNACNAMLFLGALGIVAKLSDAVDTWLDTYGSYPSNSGKAAWMQGFSHTAMEYRERGNDPS